MCAIYDAFNHMKHFQAIKMRKINKFDLISKHVIIRFIIIILTTLSLVLLRLYIMDFHGPTFKPRENPIAAADSFFTRVSRKQDY